MGYGSTRGHAIAVIVGPDEEQSQVFNLRVLATRQEDRGLSWSTLEDSVQSALGLIQPRTPTDTPSPDPRP
jgi:histidyl-tRNA synthetase